ncbi:MAG: hypothetical protein WCJ01_01345 [Ignavibacteria bacterium]
MKNIFNQTFVVLLFLTLSLSAVKAQDALFNVIATGGKVTQKNIKTGEWLPLKAGARLSSGDVIRLGKNDFVGLAHSGGKSVELRTEGTFEADKLAAKIGNASNSISKNIAGYVMNEISTVQKSSKNMKMLGAVVRQGGNTIELNSPVTTNLIEPSLNISWNTSPDSKLSIFHLISPDGKTIYMQTTTESSLKLDMKDFRLQKEAGYKWFVSSGTNNTIISDSACFYLLSDIKIAAVKDTLASLNSGITEESSLLNSIYTAAFYERNNLNNDALRLYENINNQPIQVEGFKNKFAGFLINAGMQTRARIIIDETGAN